MRKLTTEEFIERATQKHNHKYDYSKVIYKSKRDKVIIICPIHGEFRQLAGNHLRGQGCPECGKKYSSEYFKNNYKAFVKESHKRFNNHYSFPYIEKEYINSHSKITCICNKCGCTFIKLACDHLTSPFGGCKKCYSHTSKSQNQLSEYIQNLLSEDEIIIGDRDVLNGKEIDIYIPKEKIGIEYNGVYWHNSDRKGKNYHLLKTELSKRKGVKLIHIFEDELVEHKQIVFSKLKHILNKEEHKNKIGGRNCKIFSINNKIAKDFLNEYHIQGYVSSTVYYGAYYQDKLIAVMSFKRLNKKNNDWELTRFASDYNYICCGVGGKLFKHFIREYNPDLVKSFADRRWTIDEENNIYIQLGFKFDKYLRPDYRYIIHNQPKRYHKFNFRKKILLKKYPNKLNENMTETEMCNIIKAHKIYDCGLIKYIWKKQN